jgi:hypothetical protein
MDSYWKKFTFISEGMEIDKLHLNHPSDPHRAICGKKAMRKDLDIDNWDSSQPIPYTICEKCDQIKNDHSLYHRR